MELIEAIAEVREWRYGFDEPMWLQPLARPALELGLRLGLIVNTIG
jgi:hypothetical protein